MGTDIYLYAEVRRNGSWELANIEIPDDRNYWSFAVLANVHNGHGFAGCDVGEPVQPISEPRGIPADTSIREKNNAWLGDHSFSWVTLRELLDLDLDKPVIERVMVTKEQADQFRETGERPQSWCSWTTQEAYEMIQWETPLREAAWLLPKIIEALEPLGHPQDVRLVFGFSS